MIQDLADKIWGNVRFQRAAKAIERAWLTTELKLSNSSKISNSTATRAMSASALTSQKSVAFSAPTSGGKSFVLELYLASLFDSQDRNVVYVVPTRALITQVPFALCEGQQNLIYANGADEAEDIALQLSDQITPVELTPRLLALGT